MFTTDGARVLDTTDPTNSWEALNDYTDIPITVIQTGNERLELDGNELTASYKEQYIVKTDSDDTIYNLPSGETATIVFPSQTDITYELEDADEHTRLRLLRKLSTPAQNDNTGIISMAGGNIAIAHSDRVDISLDYGETFQTIVYPTTAGVDYKDTASLSDDGLNFFYVHTDGVYRYDIGTEAWTLIEVVLDYSYSPALDVNYDSITIERQVKGLAIDATTKGANYCHFVNAEKFIFVLAHYRPATSDWISVVYSKGLNLTNLFDQNLNSDLTKLCCFATYRDNGADVPFHIIGANTDIWVANPYLNIQNTIIVSNDVIMIFIKHSVYVTKVLAMGNIPTHIYRWHDFTEHDDTSVSNYIYGETLDITQDKNHNTGSAKVAVDTTVSVLVKRLGEYANWYSIACSRYWTQVSSGGYMTFTVDLQLIHTSTSQVWVKDADKITMIYYIDKDTYIQGGTLLFDNTIEEWHYYAPLSIRDANNIVISNNHYLIFDEDTDSWYTNIPLLATLTYTYLSDTEFTQVPTAHFNDQNLWLAMNKTLWIGNLIDDKLSVLPINSNKFSKEVTGIIPMSTTSKAIFFEDSITLCEQEDLSNGSSIWYYYPLKFSVGVRKGDSVITTNEGKFTIFPTKFGLAALTYQLDIAATEQAITYLSDDIKTLWSEFYRASNAINILHSNTQLLLSNSTNQVLIYDFRTNGWYPLNFPTLLKISRIQANADNYELLELQPADAEITSLTNLYELNKEADELYTYATPYKDLGTTIIPWHLTSQLLLLEAPNNYKNISQVMIDQIDSAELKQSAYFTAQIFRQRANIVKPSIELIYDIDTFAKIVKKVNWWKVLGFKWQLENDASSSYPTQLRLYNISISYDISYEVK
jgi:hypothetical protein